MDTRWDCEKYRAWVLQGNKTNDGLLVRRHADQIKVTCADQEFETITPPSSDQLRPVVHSIPNSVVVENSEPKTVAAGPRNTGISNDAQQSESETVSGLSWFTFSTAIEKIRAKG